MESIDQTTVAVGAETNPRASGAELEVPKQLGRYRIDGVLGTGGMSVVYLAFDDRLGRQVALKVMRAVTGDSQLHKETEARLVREAQAIAGLSHPNVVQVFDVGQIEGRVYMAMELVHGKSLLAWMRAQPHAWTEKVRSMIDAGRGLQAAHELAIVHRDFKPTNVLVGNDGRVRVLDFGLARTEHRGGLSSDPGSSMSRHSDSVELALSSESLSGSLPALTQAGTVMGTPAYMAPEQVRGEVLDARCDQFSFCVTLHQCLYGKLPFDGASIRIRWRNAQLGRVRPEPADSAVPQRVRQVILRGLMPDPEARWRDMKSLLSALERTIEPRRAWPWLAAGVASIAAVAVAVVAATPHEDPCDRAAGEELSDTWNAQTRADMSAAFAASTAPSADQAWQRNERTIDAYVQQWLAAREASCTDTALSAEARSAQLRCFEHGRAQLEAMTSIFATADAGIVRRSAETLATLQPVSECASADMLDAAPAPPPASVADQVADVRLRLSSVGVLRDAQRYERALEVGAAAFAKAEELGFDPLRAEALSEQAHTHESQGELEKGAQLYEQAYYVAESSGHDQLAAEVATSLFFIYGYRLSETHRAERWRGQAEATVARIAHVAPKLKAELIRTEGTVALRSADYARARERFELAISLYEELGLTESLPFAEVLSDLGAAQIHLGELEVASENMEYARSVTEAMVGAAHPRVSAIVNNLGMLEQTRGRHDLAYQHFLRSYEIDAALFGREHISVAMGLNNVGTALLILNRAEEATQYFEDSISVYESGDHHGLDLARPVGNLGVVYTRSKEYDRAIEVLLRAISLIETAEGPLHAELSAQWLNLGSVYLELGRHDDALEAMGRALAVDTAALGADHPLNGQTLASMAVVHIDLEQFDLAKPLLERALKLQSAGEVDPVNLAATRFDLARTLWSDQQQRERAEELARLSESALVAAGVPGEERLKTLLRWKHKVGLR